MKTTALLLATILTSAFVARAAVMTSWNFNSVPPDANVATGTLIPSIGTGTASGVGGVNVLSYFTGSAGDPAAAGGDNSGWSATGFPLSTVGNKTAGVQFNTGTAGFTDIVVKWEQRASGTASKFTRFQYTTDGTSWIDSTLFAFTNASFFDTRSVDLSSVAGVDNNALFAFRIVSEFNPTNATSYYGVSSAYSTNGTWRFDMVSVEGTVEVPEPAVVLTNGLVLVGGVAGMWAYRRRRSK